MHQFDHEISVHNHLPKYFKSSKQYDPDTPNFHQAMSGEFSHKFKTAMDSELEGLTKRKVWSLVSRPPIVKVIPGTWAFKIKRKSDGSLNKFKACFCVRGDLQKR